MGSSPVLEFRLAEGEGALRPERALGFRVSDWAKGHSGHKGL